jgi:hypothetical protein
VETAHLPGPVGQQDRVTLSRWLVQDRAYPDRRLHQERIVKEELFSLAYVEDLASVGSAWGQIITCQDGRMSQEISSLFKVTILFISR